MLVEDIHMQRRIIDVIITWLEVAYNRNRDPRTAAAPEASPQFFRLWSEQGFPAAWRFMIEREKRLGHQRLPANIKVLCSLLGSFLLSLGVRRRAAQPQSRFSCGWAALYSIALFALKLSDDPPSPDDQ